MKKVIIKESALLLLKESQEEVTFYKFFNEAKAFLKELLNNPLHPNIPDFFKTHGISKSVLINRMLDRDIITKKESINEPYDADGNKKSMHYLEYKVPKKDFERKLRRLYTYFFENNKNNDEN